MAKAADLIKVLSSKSQFEPVDVQEGANQIRILGRVRQDGTTTPMDNWLLMMNAIATREEQPGCAWKVDISKKYFRRGNKFIFAWRLIIQGEGVADLLPELISVVGGAPLSSRNEVTEIALLGARGDRNTPTKGKGAGVTGTIPVGPMSPGAMRGLR